MLHKRPDFGESVVQRSRRNSNDIRLSLVTDHSSLLQLLGHSVEQPWLEQEAQLSPSCLGVRRGDDAERSSLIRGTDQEEEEVLEVCGQENGFRANLAHGRLLENGERGTEGRQVDGGGVRDLKALGPGNGLEFYCHWFVLAAAVTGGNVMYDALDLLLSILNLSALSLPYHPVRRCRYTGAFPS